MIYKKQVDELEQRVITLETLCAQMNTNISSIQTIIEALKATRLHYRG